jgi:hypothetical protein
LTTVVNHRFLCCYAANAENFHHGHNHSLSGIAVPQVAVSLCDKQIVVYSNTRPTFLDSN